MEDAAWSQTKISHKMRFNSAPAQRPRAATCRRCQPGLVQRGSPAAPGASAGSSALRSGASALALSGSHVPSRVVPGQPAGADCPQQPTGRRSSPIAASLTPPPARASQPQQSPTAPLPAAAVAASRLQGIRAAERPTRPPNSKQQWPRAGSGAIMRA